MRARALALALALALAVCPPAWATEIEGQIREGLAISARLKPMEPHGSYTLPAQGKPMTGGGDDFLRMRMPAEVLASGLSSGCGDYAAVFYDALKAKGAQVRYIDAVELSIAAYMTHDIGHTAVAVKDPAIGRWVLVDPTFRALISYDWQPENHLYVGPAGRHWIWYDGRLEDYPGRGHPALKALYAKALAAIPREVWERELVRLDFTAAPSTRKPDGSFINPHLGAFLARYKSVYDQLGVHPRRTAHVTFVGGPEGYRSGSKRTGADTWEAEVATQAGPSTGYFTSLEHAITAQLGAN